MDSRVYTYRLFIGYTMANVVPVDSINNATSGVAPSSLGSSATGSWTTITQSLDFDILRQNLKIPDGTYWDNHVAVPVGGEFSLTPTHNRIVVYGTASVVSVIEKNATYNNGARVAHTFKKLKQASGTDYASGVGTIETTQEGLIRLVTTTSNSEYNKKVNFTFSLKLEQGTYVDDTINVNKLIRMVADEIRFNYIPEFNTTLLYI